MEKYLRDKEINDKEMKGLMNRIGNLDENNFSYFDFINIMQPLDQTD
jgi:hypothetical protein